MKKTALLLIDIQNDYFPGGKMELHQMEVASINAALLSNRNEIMSYSLNRVINTRFAALPLPQVKISTTDYADSHRLRNKVVF